MEPNQQIPTPKPSMPAIGTEPLPVAPLIGPTRALGLAWETFKANWKALSAAIFIPMLILVIPSVIFMERQPGAPTLRLWVMTIGILISIGAGVCATIAQLGTITSMQSLSSGEPVTLGSVYRAGRKLFWPAVGAGIIFSLATSAGFLLIIIPGVVIVVYAGFYAYAVAIDGHRGFSSLSESYSLVKGRWFKVLWRYLFFALVYAAVALIMAGIEFVIKASFGYAGKSVSAVIVNGVLGAVSGALVAPIAVSYFYSIYASLKESRMGTVATRAFRNWCITAFVLGALLVPLLLLSVVLVSIDKAREKAKQAASASMERQLDIQRQIDREAAGSPKK